MTTRRTGSALLAALSLGICIIFFWRFSGQALGLVSPGTVAVRDLSVAGPAAPGSPVRLTLHLKDADLRVRAVRATVISPDGVDRVPVQFQPLKGAGKWEATFALSAAAMAGDWTVTDLTATDDTGAADALGVETSFAVAEQGNEGPKIGVQIYSGKVRETHLVPVTLTLPESLTVTRAELALVGPAGQVSRQLIYLPEGAAGQVELSLRVVRGFGAGAWRLSRITLTENGGRTHVLHHGRDFDGKLNVVAGRVDRQAPAITSVTMEPAIPKTGGTLQIQAIVTDDLSSVTAVGASLMDPTGASQGKVRLTEAQDGTWKGEVPIPLYAPAGEWSVVLDAVDEAGNRAGKGAGQRLTVQAGHADPPAPRLESVTLTANGGQLKVSAAVSGDVPVAAISAALKGPGAVLPIELPLEGTAAAGYVGRLPLPEHTPSGEWKVTAVRVTDALGRTAEAAPPVSPVSVTTAKPDAAPPVLESISLSDGAKPGDRVRVTLRATDDLSGLDAATAILAGPSGRMLRVPLAELEDGSWSGTALVPDDAPQGAWRVKSVQLVDAAWNAVVIERGE